MNIQSAQFVKGVVRGDTGIDPTIPQVVMYGRSNAGKSSTINKITNNKGLARVSNMPGRTREINFFLINQQWYLVDMPGYGYARASKSDREMLSNLIQWFINDSIVQNRKSVLIVDCKIGLTDSDRDILNQLIDRGESILILLNKSDRLTQKQIAKTQAALRSEISGEIPVILFSAKTGKGIKEFWNIVIEGSIE
jgi:GTP-binding protein